MYTGTRASAICGASLTQTPGRGYVDLERGVLLSPGHQGDGQATATCPTTAPTPCSHAALAARRSVTGGHCRVLSEGAPRAARGCPPPINQFNVLAVSCRGPFWLAVQVDVQFPFRDTFGLASRVKLVKSAEAPSASRGRPKKAAGLSHEGRPRSQRCAHKRAMRRGAKRT